jgi:hypothetical protein
MKTEVAAGVALEQLLDVAEGRPAAMVALPLLAGNGVPVHEVQVRRPDSGAEPTLWSASSSLPLGGDVRPIRLARAGGGLTRTLPVGQLV